MDIKAELIVEIYKACEALGAKSDLLRVIGSIGDTLDDDEALRQLKVWNERQASASSDH